MKSSIAGKIALVTGGSRGIGAAIVRRLASEGAAVAFTYAASSQSATALVREVESDGGTVFSIEADSADAGAVRAAVALTVSRFGALDVLVNNAGIYISGVVDTYDLQDFDRMFAVNVRAGFVASQAAVAHMSPGGRIIMIGSIAAERASVPGASVYSMTKGAVASMVRGLARDLGPRGITVNTVQPGPTLTGMNASEEGHAFVKPLMALGRIGKDVEVANLVAFLASGASSFVTGAALTIDGGFLA